MLIGIQKLLLQRNFWGLGFVCSKTYAFFIIIGVGKEKNNPKSPIKTQKQKLVLQNFVAGFKPEVSFAFNQNFINATKLDKYDTKRMKRLSVEQI